MRSGTAEKTIRDFGEQWTIYQENRGYYSSGELLWDILAPLLSPKDIQGKWVAEIGSGTGRIVNMLLDAGVRKVTGIEPSAAFEVLKKNTEPRRDRVDLRPIRGEDWNAESEVDYVFSIGVIHHIPDPQPTVRAAFRALRPGGRFFVWLYGHEGNDAYLGIISPLRVMTSRLPHSALRAMVWGCYAATTVYAPLCKFLPLPMCRYFRDVYSKFGPPERRLAIYDQLNPAYAKYYRRDEAIRLLEDGGFKNVSIHQRHGYSWSVIGTKPT